MLKILEKIGNNIYKEDHSVKKKGKPKRKRRKAKKNKKELSDMFFQSIIAEIEKNGSRTIRVTTMMMKEIILNGICINILRFTILLNLFELKLMRSNVKRCLLLRSVVKQACPPLPPVRDWWHV